MAVLEQLALSCLDPATDRYKVPCLLQFRNASNDPLYSELAACIVSAVLPAKYLARVACL
jgi:hypothetical protein